MTHSNLLVRPSTKLIGSISQLAKPLSFYFVYQQTNKVNAQRTTIK